MQDAASYADREALRVLIRRHLKELELKISINLLLRVDFVDDALDLALSSYPKSVLFQQLLSLYKLGSGKVPINVSRLYERLGEKFSGAELRHYIERRSWVIKHVGNHEEVWDFLKGLEMYLDGDKSGMASSLGAASSGALGVQQVVAQHQSMSSMQQLLTAEDILESSGALAIPHFNN